jgi:hypothetical protein
MVEIRRNNIVKIKIGKMVLSLLLLLKAYSLINNIVIGGKKKNKLGKR